MAAEVEGVDLGVVLMVFGFGFANKTVKELRKNQGLTVQELAQRLKLDPGAIAKIDNLRVRDVPEPLKTRLIPLLRGDHTDKMPWL